MGVKRECQADQRPQHKERSLEERCQNRVQRQQECFETGQPAQVAKEEKEEQWQEA